MAVFCGAQRINKSLPHLFCRSFVFCVFILLTHVLLLLPFSVAWHGDAALLILSLPGILLALLVFSSESDLLTRIFIGLCGGLTLPVPLLLALQALPGPLSGWWVLLASDGLTLVLAWLLAHQHADAPIEIRWPPRAVVFMLGTIIVIGAVLRLRSLGSAEFQGDEARALLMAVGAFHGQDGILMLHTKGPVEILLPLGLLVMTGQINEWVARLPFALAGIGTILGSYVLARALGGDSEHKSSTSIGLTAATIVALNGLLIAFSRIVQYQSVLVLLMLGALWCCWRFYAGASQPQRYLVSAAVLAAVGLLAHYDGVFVLPALLWLTLAGCQRRGWRAAQWASMLAWPALIGTVLIGSFYIPFVLDEHFSQTLHYLMNRVGQEKVHSVLYNQLTTYQEVATVYSTTFQVYSLSLVLAAACVVWLCKYVRPRIVGYGAALLLLAGCILMLRSPALMDFNAGQSSWAIVMFGLPVATLALAPRTPAALRALIIWFACPFVVEAFMIISPNTHFYTMEMGVALLAGIALVQLFAWLHQRRSVWLERLLVLSGGAVLLLAIPYLYTVFVRQTPEYRRDFPEARPAIYRASYGDTLPDIGYFGFPHRSGWKVIGELYEQGLLRGNYMSNEEALITGWYTHGATRKEHNPDYYFVATTPNDPIWISNKKIRESYHLFGTVMVDGSKKLSIYSLKPVPHQPFIFALDAYRNPFDKQPIAQFPIEETLK